MKTIIRYAGGKSKAIKLITPMIEDYDTIISPFIGGGSLEVHWASLGKKVIGYDMFDILCNFWNVLLNDNIELFDNLDYLSYKVLDITINDKLSLKEKTQLILEKIKN